MVPSYWLETPKFSTTYPSLLPIKLPITSYEWEMNNFSLQNQEILGEKEEKGDGIQEEKPKCEWDFALSSVVSSSAVGTASDTLGVIEFDPSGSVLATGGIARKIRIYNSDKLLSHGNNFVARLDHANACDYYICTPAKLSSLKWKPGSGQRVIGSGDYDGVVMEYDLEKRMPIFERDEHGGRRIWSIDYSPWDPMVGASGSDDGTVQLWDTRSNGGDHTASIQPSSTRSSICCVEFDPFGGSMLAVGCADKKAYGYDVRNLQDPVMVLEGHSRTVTYVRFLDRASVATAGTDGCLMLWDTEDRSLIRTFRGHANSKRFVGLSVLKTGGLLCCGSESNEVFVYDRRWAEPVWVHGFDPGRNGSGPPNPGFVSGVCWRQMGENNCMLVAGGSDGVLQVFEGKRRLF